MSREQKRIAVIVRADGCKRQSEALRRGLGLSVLNKVDIYILDAAPAMTEDTILNLEMIKEMKIGLYSNVISNNNESIKYINEEDIAKMLLEYDNILIY